LGPPLFNESIPQGLLPGIKLLIRIKAMTTKFWQIGNPGHTDHFAFARPDLQFAIIVIRDLHDLDYGGSLYDPQDVNMPNSGKVQIL